MGFFDKKIQQAQENAMQQSAAAQQGAMQQGGMGGYDPMEAMRQAGMDPNAALAGAMANPGNPAELMAERDRIQRLNASGVPGRATVVSAQDIGTSAGGVGIDTQLQLQVTEGPGAGGTINVKQSMVGDPGWYQAGQSVALKINPDNPQEALVSGS